jgi:hypothetical protein
MLSSPLDSHFYIPSLTSWFATFVVGSFFFYSGLVESLIKVLISLPSLPKHNRRYIPSYIPKIKCRKKYFS